jgi:hypothetical protein
MEAIERKVRQAMMRTFICHELHEEFLPMLRPSSGSKFSRDELGSAVSERPVFIGILRN